MGKFDSFCFLGAKRSISRARRRPAAAGESSLHGARASPLYDFCAPSLWLHAQYNVLFAQTQLSGRWR
jgi:hypothetical protein